MHSLTPNTEYVVVNLQVAVLRQDVISGAYRDGISALMDNAMNERYPPGVANAGDKYAARPAVGVISDWRINDPPTVHYRTGDICHEGMLFDVEPTLSDIDDGPPPLSVGNKGYLVQALHTGRPLSVLRIVEIIPYAVMSLRVVCEDGSMSSISINEWYQLTAETRAKAFEEYINRDPDGAALMYVQHKVDEWMNDGQEEAVRCVASWMTSGLDLSNPDTLLSAASGSTLFDSYDDPA